MDANNRILDVLSSVCKKDSETGTENSTLLDTLIKAYCLIHNDKEGMQERIKERMKMGLERYGHGIRLEDDTRQWGTRENSWLEMCEEEILDGIIYSISHKLRNL
jgi:hypothetical protein